MVKNKIQLILILIPFIMSSCSGGVISGPPVPVSRLTISPSKISIAPGSVLQLHATATYVDSTSRDISSLVTWTSTTPSVAYVSPNGMITGVGLGSSIITVSYGSTTTMQTVGVSNGGSTNGVLISIQIVPSTSITVIGQPVQFVATGTYSDGSTQNITSSVTWSSTIPGVASISGGLATPGSLGTTSIAAQLGSVTSSSSILTVTGATLASLTITPSNSTIHTLSGPVQFTATGTFSDSSTANMTNTAIWISSDITKCLVGNDIGIQGLVVPLVFGSSTISAVIGVVVGSTNVNVSL